ncbi:MAG: hypothetical protein ACI97B_003352 [Verrucomicrobiales bacterium]|jgi:hypothetical protein
MERRSSIVNKVYVAWFRICVCVFSGSMFTFPGIDFGLFILSLLNQGRPSSTADRLFLVADFLVKGTHIREQFNELSFIPAYVF